MAQRRCLQDCVGADTLVGGQYPGAALALRVALFRIEGGTVLHRGWRCVQDYVHRRGSVHLCMTDTSGKIFCCEFSANTILRWMASQEPSAVAETFKTWYGEAFMVVCGTSSTADYQQDVAYDVYPFQASWSLYHDLSSCCRFWL
jgi:hypothetical protein